MRGLRDRNGAVGLAPDFSDVVREA